MEANERDQSNFTTQAMKVQVLAEYNTGLLMSPAGVRIEDFPEEMKHKQSSFGFTMGRQTEVNIPVPRNANPLVSTSKRKSGKRQIFYDVNPVEIGRQVFTLSDVIYPHRWRAYTETSTIFNPISRLHAKIDSVGSAVRNRFIQTMMRHIFEQSSDQLPVFGGEFTGVVSFLYCLPIKFDQFTANLAKFSLLNSNEAEKAEESKMLESYGSDLDTKHININLVGINDSIRSALLPEGKLGPYSLATNIKELMEKFWRSYSSPTGTPTSSTTTTSEPILFASDTPLLLSDAAKSPGSPSYMTLGTKEEVAVLSMIEPLSQSESQEESDINFL